MVELLACRVCLCTNFKLYNIYQHQLNFAYESLTGCKVLPQDGCPQYICNVCSTLLLKWLSFKNVCQKSQDKLKYAYGQNTLITTEYITSLQLSTPFLAKYSTSRSSISLTYNEDKEIKDEVYRDNDIKDVVYKEDDIKDVVYRDNDIKDVVYKDNDIKDEIHKDNDIKDDVYNDNDNTFNDDTNTFAIDIDFNNDSDDFNNKKDKSENSSSNAEPLASKKVEKKKRKVKKVNVKSKKQDNGIQENDDDEDNLENYEIELRILTKEQQIEEIEARMKSRNYLHSLYKCEKCYKGFKSAATYKNHMLRHDPSSGSHVCEICHSRFRTSGLRHTHVVAHGRKYACKLCAHVSNSKPKAKEHFKWHGGHKYICEQCGAFFEKITSHLTHVRIHHPSKYSCEVCGESFIGEHGLKMHKVKAHRVVEGEDKEESPRCSRCDVNFHTMDALKKHMTESECKNTKACPQCGENFKTEQLKEHLKIHLNIEKLKCDQCNRTFEHWRSYANHMHRKHSGVKLKKKYSGKTPSSSVPSRNTAAVVCEVCGKKCKNNSTLSYHQRTHSGEKPYKCADCPKRFSLQTLLQLHTRVHTGERPHKCEYCPKMFKSRSALNRHILIHTGERDHICQLCGMAFATSTNVKAHVRTVHMNLKRPNRPRNRRPRTHE